jgi:hypothetical protein
MGLNDHIDSELSAALQELITNGFVIEGGTPFDVSQKVIDQGKASLTPAELQIFDEEIVPALAALDESKSEAVADTVGRPPIASARQPESKFD